MPLLTVGSLRKLRTVGTMMTSRSRGSMRSWKWVRSGAWIRSGHSESQRTTRSPATPACHGRNRWVLKVCGEPASEVLGLGCERGTFFGEMFIDHWQATLSTS